MCYAVEEVGEFESREGKIMVFGLEFMGFACNEFLKEGLFFKCLMERNEFWRV